MWSVRDRISGKELALKFLAVDAGEAEIHALVREASALSGLEGLGVPRVVAFGSVQSSGTPRRFLVREMVHGHSLNEIFELAERNWIRPLENVCDKLTAIHRAGLLHGDIKPANIIVHRNGEASMVDLGLAVPWREGAVPTGLTPKYAAPELFAGASLSVRAEVFSLGATLSEGLKLATFTIPTSARIEIERVAKRATSVDPSLRYPSVDEFAEELRRASGRSEKRDTKLQGAWPVVGIETISERLRDAALALPPRTEFHVVGKLGVGKSTLLRRLAWTLGVQGKRVALIDQLAAGVSLSEAVAIEFEGGPPDYFILCGQHFGADLSAAREKILTGGSRFILESLPYETQSSEPARMEISGLEARWMLALLERSLPSLSDENRALLLQHAEGCPGELRRIVRKIGERAIVSSEDLLNVLREDAPREQASPPASRSEALERVDRLVEMGRLLEATKALGEAPPASGPASSLQSDKVRTAVLLARIEFGRGATDASLSALESVNNDVKGTSFELAWTVMFARVALRRGEYERARTLAASIDRAGNESAWGSLAKTTLGLANAFLGNNSEAITELEEAIAIARKAESKSAEGVALGSLAIVFQRVGRSSEAKAAYTEALQAAEQARDAATVALTHGNLAIFARTEGDFSSALTHFEAAVDMGRRAGVTVALQNALLGLSNLDLYLGRLSRARASIEALREDWPKLSMVHQATLLGLEADHAARCGETSRAYELYEQCARAWEGQKRPIDALEALLEGVLALATDASTSNDVLERAYRSVLVKSSALDLGEHKALAHATDGAVALRLGEEEKAKHALDAAIAEAQALGRREWEWGALYSRSELFTRQGARMLAKRDLEKSVGILEEIAAKLPRDLREVFWNDRERKAVREASNPSEGFGSAPTGLRAFASERSLHRRVSTTFSAVLPAEERLRLIMELTRELASELDLSRLLIRVTDHAITLLGGERGIVAIQQEDGSLLAFTARGKAKEDADAGFSRSIAEKVLESGEAIVTTRAGDDERFAAARSVHQFSIQSVACVPIRSRSAGAIPIGALYVETRLRPGLHFERELPTLQIFADQAAIAIENARLLEENQKHAKELERTNEELKQAKDRLSEVLGRRTEQLVSARRDLREVREKLHAHFGYGGLTGTSEPMRKVFALIERVKDNTVPILVTGESGTGKEVVAKAIHSAGPRAKRPFIGVNCGAIPQNLLEGELFGHMRGAFTGADRDRKGLFREAEGGTILLDEIGEMPLSMQAGLLRVLQEGTVRPVGGTNEERIDVRVIAATNRDLKTMIAEGSFREDLYYRLHVVEIRIPSLRERADDIPALIDHFLTLFATKHGRPRKAVSRDALRALMEWPWPGNVRELENALLNAWLMGDEEELLAEDFEFLGVRPRDSLRPALSPRPSLSPRVDRRSETPKDFKSSEKEDILGALASTNWNRAQAAKRLGIPRRTFYRRLKEFGIV